MKKILIDTDVLINFLRENHAVKEYLESIVNDSVIYCSTITVAKIYAGMRESERKKTINLIDSLNIADVTRNISEKAGIYKRDEKKQILELDDCIIAATAFEKGAALVTCNGKHYPMQDIKKEILR
ncbi:MAG: type II toxin-antitoxin system VapC family toxin [bacterium]